MSTTTNLRPPWPKGSSGNPSGRPGGQAGFAQKIRARTKSGRLLWTFALEVLAGQHDATVRERLDAMKWLADRGWGRVPETVDDPLSEMTDDELLHAVKRAVEGKLQ